MKLVFRQFFCQNVYIEGVKMELLTFDLQL